MLSFYAVYAAWSDKKEWIKCVEIWVVAGLPWPHVQFQPQMGLMGGPGLCVAHFPPDIATQGNLKSSRKKVWSGQVSDSFQSLLFFSTTRVGLYKVNWSADPAQSEKFKPDPNEVTRWWHFLGKAGSAPPTNIDLCSRFEIYPLCNSGGTLDPDFCIFCRHYRSSTLNFSFLRRLWYKGV